MRGLRIVALLVLVLGGCDRRPEPPPGPAPSPAPARPAAPAPTSAGAASATTVVEPTWRFPAARRVVAIGDLHGDLDAARAALRLAGAIDADDEWIGKDLVVVQTGDLVDRGDADRQVLDFVERLTARALEAGGALHLLNGNHEEMNVQGDYRYVSTASFAEFADLADRAPPTANVPREARGRAAAFFPGGPYARQLATRNAIEIVGDTVFAHGGVTPSHVKYGIGRINGALRAWMAGNAPAPRDVMGEESPSWTRRYSEGELSDLGCGEVASVLASLNVARMVVGHTVQKGGVTSTCGGKVWRIDVGLSHLYGGKPEVLEIEGQRVKPLRR